jgi:hypothetical protein
MVLCDLVLGKTLPVLVDGFLVDGKPLAPHLVDTGG